MPQFRLRSSKREVKKRVAKWVTLLSCLYHLYIVYRVLSIYRVLPGFREFAVFEKSKRFFILFLDGRYREGIKALTRAQIYVVLCINLVLFHVFVYMHLCNSIWLYVFIQFYISTWFYLSMIIIYLRNCHNIRL